ncbi:MAG: hypothetical protein IPL79_08690 [Myxococcales bacterium]|nr:hypothetical protein [Myxococcales bacterium]
MKITSLLSRSTLTGAALVSSLSLFSCGGDSGPDVPTPTGTVYDSVIDGLQLPTSDNNFKVFDFNDDGVNDNVLANALGILVQSTGQSIDVLETATNGAILEGSSIYLVAFQTPDFTTASGAGFTLATGSNPSPAPCTDPNEPATCGQHLDGSGSFDSDDESAQLAGKIVSGVFEGGADQDITLNVVISIEAGVAVPIPLSGARVKLSGISATGITSGIIGGVLTIEDRDTKTFPGIVDTLQAIITRDCESSDLPDDAPDKGVHCHCTNGSTGASVSTIAAPTDACVVELTADLQGLLETIISDDIEGVGSSVALGFSTVEAAIN